jgi:hypothetical protein
MDHKNKSKALCGKSSHTMSNATCSISNPTITDFEFDKNWNSSISFRACPEFDDENSPDVV